MLSYLIYALYHKVACKSLISIEILLFDMLALLKYCWKQVTLTNVIWNDRTFHASVLLVEDPKTNGRTKYRLAYVDFFYNQSSEEKILTYLTHWSCSDCRILYGRVTCLEIQFIKFHICPSTKLHREIIFIFPAMRNSNFTHFRVRRSLSATSPSRLFSV